MLSKVAGVYHIMADFRKEIRPMITQVIMMYTQMFGQMWQSMMGKPTVNGGSTVEPNYGF